MKVVEQKIIEAMDGPDGDYRLSGRDAVYNRTTEGADGIPTITSRYKLHNSTVAYRCERLVATMSLGVEGGYWQTLTTKCRINAVAVAYGLPGVRQKNYRWKWDDGVDYDGVRVFILSGGVV
jgi:hypothetical protein